MEYCDTLHPSGYRLLFSDELIKQGTDSLLLADFARPKRGMQVCDLGQGSAFWACCSSIAARS